jgi:putative ABC transport system ATP-binding protein
MIEVNKLTREYKTGAGGVLALNNVSFNVKSGEFISITGKSGSGKSTLLYQIGLLDYPTSGNVRIGDINVLKLKPHERTYFRLTSLGYVFQDYALIPSLNALENVQITLLMRGMSGTEADNKAKEALEKVGLGHRTYNLPSQLSGGEQQRVAIARAISDSPQIIFADEPTANLDSDTSKVVLDTFLNLHKEGQTIIMVTHEPEYAAITDRIIELADGRLVADSNGSGK